VAEHRDLARDPVAEALADLDGGGLAGAIRPEKGEHLALGYVEADSPDRLDVAVALPKVVDDDGSAHGVESSVEG
jgi:hypothetical protein